MPQMTDQTLKGILAARIRSAVGFDGSDEYSQERAKAEKFYKGEPQGDEVAGKSQVVSRDVAEAVDAILPSLLKIFTSGDEVVRFEPTGPEDVAGAEQATDYVNYIWTQKNPGFRNFQDWFKDALLKRLGTVKIWWEVKEDVTREKYAGLTDAQLQMLAMDEGIEIVEKQSYPGYEGMVHNVTLSQRKEYGCAKVKPVPPDELLIDRRAGSDDEPFGHRCRRTISDLVAEGYDEDQVKALSSDEDSDNNTETLERFQSEDPLGHKDGDLDPTMREVWVTELYVNVDYDGDGIAELRKITVGGDGSSIEILKRDGKDDNEETDDNPFASLTPIPMSHKLIGMSLTDKTRDLQQVKTVLWRKSLDSMYLQLEPMVGAVEGQVNLDDLLNRRVGGVVRMKTPNALFPIPTEDVSANAFNMIAYVDSVREARTGVRRFSAGPGADALNNAYTQTATGAQLVNDSSDEMILYFARVFAETGVKKAFKKILGLVCKHQNKPDVIRLRNQWVEVDPRTWKTGMDMTVSVGLGTGSKAQQLGTITNLLNLDEKIVALQGGVNGPLLTAKNIYNKLAKLVQASELKSIEPYYTDPETAPPQQPKPNPEMMKLQAEMQMKQQEAQSNAQLAQQQAQLQAQLEQQKMEKAAQVEAMQAQADIAVKREEANLRFRLEEMKARSQIQIAQYKARLDSRLAVQNARIRGRESRQKISQAQRPS